MTLFVIDSNEVKNNPILHWETSSNEDISYIIDKFFYSKEMTISKEDISKISDEVINKGYSWYKNLLFHCN